MGTYSNFVIKHHDLEEVLDIINEYYILGKRQTLFGVWDDFLYRDTLIAYQAKKDWIMISYYFGPDMYSFDPIFIRITEKLKTIAAFGYEQNTADYYRFAYYKDGEILRSIAHFYHCDNLDKEHIENFGEPFPFENNDYNNHKDIDDPIYLRMTYCDNFHFWFRELGFDYELDEHNIHISVDGKR